MLPHCLIDATHHFLLWGGESDEERERVSERGMDGGRERGRQKAARPVSGYETNRAADVMLRRAQAFHLLRLGVWGEWHTLINTHLHMQGHTHADTDSHRCTHAYMHVHTNHFTTVHQAQLAHFQIHTCAHTHPHIHTYIHIQVNMHKI